MQAIEIPEPRSTASVALRQRATIRALHPRGRIVGLHPLLRRNSGGVYDSGRRQTTAAILAAPLFGA